MATVYYDPAGTILGFVRDNGVVVQVPPGQHASSPLIFDDLANPSLAGLIASNQNSCKIVAGQLQLNGVVQTIAAPTQAANDAAAIKANAAALFSALRAGTATNAQVQRVLAFLLRQFLQG